MEFSLSWLHEYVDLSDHFDLQRDEKGFLHGFVDQEKAFQVGERLTAIGLAVEGYPIAMVGPEMLDQEQLLDVDVTGNRPDAMCHAGLARELAVALDVPLRLPEVPRFEISSTDGSSGTVVIEDAEGCPRFTSRVIRGVRVGPSPEWLVRRLKSIGSRSINNVVDATNFVLWETGQPLHAYDLATIPGGELRVRRARPGETLVTLDGEKRELDPEILVIADRERAVGIAGIMGGLDTEVTETTTDVLLEVAHFDRRVIRRGAKRLGLHTDASHRFERGADFDACDAASRRCAALIAELAGGEVVEPAVDAVARRPEPIRWILDAAALERFAGCAVGDDEIERILSGLGFAPQRDGERRWSGAVPGWRAVDFEPRRGVEPPTAYAQDVYEEVLRQIGLDRLPSTLPTIGGVDAGVDAAHRRDRWIRDLLAGLGFAETIHYAFQDRAWDAAYPTPDLEGGPVALANPLSERLAVLRRSLVPNLVAAAEFNANRGAEGVALFELGHLFPDGGREELGAVALVLGGELGTPWDRRPTVDLWDLKGAGEVLAAALALPIDCRPASLPGIAEGSGARWLDGAGRVLGWSGRVERADLPFPLFALELRLDRAAEGGDARRRVEPPPRLPGVSADLTLTHATATAWAEIESTVEQLRPPLLAGFRLEDRYAGKGVPEGAVATTIRFDYHGGDRSLTQDEVNEAHSALAAELARRFGVERKEGG